MSISARARGMGREARVPSPHHTLTAALYSVQLREFLGHVLLPCLCPSQQRLSGSDMGETAAVRFLGTVGEAGVCAPTVRGR